MTHSHTFFLDEMPVGIFEDQEFPRSPGRYRYLAYRGMGHYQMQTQLKAGSTPRCFYDDGDFHISFTVHACPDYGVLELRDFEISPRDAS